MSAYNPPPPYDASIADPKKKQVASISTLPLHLLHRIISLTLDPRATPSLFSGDYEEEKVRRLWALFRGIRGVDRRFFSVSTSILRTHFVGPYLAHLPRNASSDPFPHSSHPAYGAEVGLTSSTSPSILVRSRETAIFDRFIAIHLGDILRHTESSLSEPSEALPDLFRRLQPCARIEDLLLDLPGFLVYPDGPPKRQLPLPHSHLAVTLSPGWTSLWLYSGKVAVPQQGKMGRDLVLEVRRQETAERCVSRLREGLEDMQNGLAHWGERIL